MKLRRFVPSQESSFLCVPGQWLHSPQSSETQLVSSWPRFPRWGIERSLLGAGGGPSTKLRCQRWSLRGLGTTAGVGWSARSGLGMGTAGVHSALLPVSSPTVVPGSPGLSLELILIAENLDRKRCCVPYSEESLLKSMLLQTDEGFCWYGVSGSLIPEPLCPDALNLNYPSTT